MSRSCALVLATVACALAPLAARADVVTFQFTGRITDTILQSGIYQPVPATTFPSSWIGQTVSGSIRMDFTHREPLILEEGQYSQVSATFDQPDASWLSMTVNQPDGSTLVIPSGPVLDLNVDPAFCPECNDAYSHINNGWVSFWSPNDPPQDGFYVQRTLINGLEQYPRQQFQLHLRGVGSENGGLVDTIDYRQVRFDPRFATWDNYGVVDHYPSADYRSTYAFTVLSLTSQVAAVPEPSAYLLAGAGMLAMFMVRRRRPAARAALPLAPAG